MTDFAEHFWGDKQNGYNVLYQNMKAGQTSVKEFGEFLKERSLIEDEYQKHLSKIIKQLINVGTVGTYSTVWLIIKNSLEKFLQLHGTLIQQLHDVAKEIHKYGEDQQKAQKAVRDSDTKTLEVINLMQTTTTCLQKSKENYSTRCVEHEKLKRENAQPKELQKSENRLKKAAEEYRQYVEKYTKIRDDYEQRMITASRNFQVFESNHLNQMKQMTLNCAVALEGSQNSIYQASTEFREQIEFVDIENIIMEFAVKKGTGTERPSFIFFEEPDLSVLLPVSDSAANLFAISEDGTALAPNVESSLNPSAPLDNVLTLDYTNDNSSALSNTLKLEHSISNGPSSFNSLPNSNNTQQSAKGKLALWLPGRKRPSNNKLTTPTPSPSGEVGGIIGTLNDGGGGGFLRKKKDSKKKKDKEIDNKSEISSEDAKSQTSGGKIPVIDDEGFSIRPDDIARNSISNNKSSSDDDSDGELQTHRIKVEIKQHPVKTMSASVDELKDAFRDVNIGLSVSTSKNRFGSREASLDEFDPAKGSGTFAIGSSDPWGAGGSSSSTPARQHFEPMRPAKTGDDRYNRLNFVGLHWPAMPQGIIASTNDDKNEPPWSADEGGDTLGRLVGSVSWSTAQSSAIARARPRSSTPTQSSADAQMSFNSGSNTTNSWTLAKTKNDSFDSSTSSALSSVSFNSPLSSFRNEPAPLAVALTETVHVLFKGSNSIGCTIKIYGNLAVSFPAALVQSLINDQNPPPPLVIKLINAEKIHALVPNGQILPT